MKSILQGFKLQLGRSGIAGILLLVFAAIFNVSMLTPLEHQVERLQIKVDHIQQVSNGQTASATHGAGSEEKLAKLYNNLADISEIPDVLATIYAISEASGVTLKQGDYHLTDKGEHLEYEMLFPLSGGYANLRMFMARCLSEHQAITLDSVNIHRDRVDTPVLSAEVRMTLFLHPAH